jgi:hypothetical protein
VKVSLPHGVLIALSFIALYILISNEQPWESEVDTADKTLNASPYHTPILSSLPMRLEAEMKARL